MTALRTTIVGLGASAGGLEAFKAFFENMPSDSGLAFVVVLHLPAHRKSMLADILGRWTAMPVKEVVDGDLIMPDCVYVPPPHSMVTVEREPLRLCLQMPADDAPRQDRPIDRFFDSLASTLREEAVGIILSGTGSDGALGLKAIKQYGGLTVVQGPDGSGPDRSGPQHEGMPSGAIAAAAVDVIASVETIPAHLLRLRGRFAATGPLQSEPARTEAERLEICTILLAQVGHDFSGYKDKTFLRRVQRRMDVLETATLADYIGRLRSDPDEVLLLFRELLIRVTSFFRDAETFALLEREVIPRLFAGATADSNVRVWVPGCATGEEAYSIAILLCEHLDGLSDPPTIQIFATDIDESAIGVARAGRYPSTLLDGLSDERRRRFFVEHEQSWMIAKEVRELCTFSAHSLVRDPPFSRIDMISCRNLLIYLDAGLQANIVPAFHYALKPGGILVLGSSETVSRHEELFTALDGTARIFVRREVRSPPLSLQPSAPRRTTRPSADEPVWPRTNTRVTGDLSASDRMPSRTAVPRRTAKGLRGRGSWGIGERVRTVLDRFDPRTAGHDDVRRELDATHRRLQALSEEHETALEELRSSNEELHSVNEELQSTNEELETSKEEIQSTNEELHTVNAQLSEKLDELDSTASDLRNLYESTQIATIFLDRHMVIRGYTPAVGSIYNLIPSDVGRPLTDIVSRVDCTTLRDDVRSVLQTLEPLDRRVTHEDGQTHYVMRILPYRAPDSSVDGTLITFLDVTSIVQAETHQRLLVDELNHRVRNMLTVVGSLAAQTIRRARTLEEFSDAFMGRVHALTASYSLLSHASWKTVTLRAVLLEELRPFINGTPLNIVLEGPVVRLAPRAALAFGMAIHELATNAVRYGALSAPTGQVAVTWLADPGDPSHLILDWIESGGPPVEPPAGRGFGSILIQRGFAHELSGSADLDFTARGLHATLRAPFGDAIVLTDEEPA